MSKSKSPHNPLSAQNRDPENIEANEFIQEVGGARGFFTSVLAVEQRNKATVASYGTSPFSLTEKEKRRSWQEKMEDKVTGKSDHSPTLFK